MNKKVKVGIVLGVMCFALTLGICIQIKTVKQYNTKVGQNYDQNNLRAEELINAFVAKGYILEFKDGDNIEEIIEKAKEFTPNEYHSNTENFIEKLKEKIGN